MRTVEGMVGNVGKNLINLGANVTQVTGDNKSIKTRFIDERSGHQLLRVDEDKISNPIKLTDIPNKKYDCVVISDYNKGSLVYSNMKKIIDKYKDIPIFIDTKKDDIERFDQIYPQTKVFIKINLPESKRLTSWHRNLIVTDGKNGASYRGTNYPTPEVSVADPCGAGDTFLAALAYSYTENQTLGIEYAIRYANYAASITVKHLGVYAPSLEEIENEIIR
jgi:D-beta-D-heptose 7-phosphate kinase/D-beta-D-heptose 1-phosphate adenosyltransferase